MGFSDEQIRDMLELKEDLTEKIIKYKEQIEKLEKNISVLDAILTGADLSHAILSGAILTGANLEDAILTNAILNCIGHSICI